MRLLVSCMFALSVTSALAQNALPSCFEYASLTPIKKAISTELFVVIDQTTPLDNSLQQSIANNMKPFLQPGNAYSVTQFSAFTQGHYTDVLVNAKLDHALETDARNDIGKNQLAKYDQCMAIQNPNAAKLAGAALRKAFSGSSSDVAKSDVLGSLKDIAGKVKQSSAKQKIVLLASDMLENSSISSFYSKQAVRQIDPQKELKLVTDNQLFADFGGAKVYVIGAGLLTADAKQAKGVYRDPKTMAALQQFWRAYFDKSNAKLIEFGQPALLNAIQ